MVAEAIKNAVPKPSIAFPLTPKGLTFNGGYLLNVAGDVAVVFATVNE